KTHWAGWRQFCAELHFLPERRWSLLPGFELLERAELLSGGCPEEDLPGLAFGDEETARCLAVRAGHDPDSKLDHQTLRDYWPPTAADIVANLHGDWKMSLERGGE